MQSVPLSPTGQYAYGGMLPHSMPQLNLAQGLFPHLVYYLSHWRHGYRTTALLFALAYLDGGLLSQFYQYCLYYWPMLDEQERDLVRRIELKLGGYAGLSQEAMDAITPLAGIGVSIEDGARMTYGLPTHQAYSDQSLGCGPSCAMPVAGVGQGCGCGCGGTGACGQQSYGRVPVRPMPQSPAYDLFGHGAGFDYDMRAQGPFNTVGAAGEDDYSDIFDKGADYVGKDKIDSGSSGGGSTKPPQNKGPSAGDVAKVIAELAKAGVDIGKQIATATGAVSPAECMQNPNDSRCATLKLPDSPAWRSFCQTPNGRVFKPCINSGFVPAVPPVTPPATGLQQQGGEMNQMLMMVLGVLTFVALGVMFMRGGI